MNEHDNKKSAIEQAEDVVNARIEATDYRMMFDLLERIHGTLMVLPRFIKHQYKDLNGIDFNVMQDTIRHTLDYVESPYDDSDEDTLPPEAIA